MCLVIVDADVAARVLITPNDREFGLLNRALFGRRRPNPILIYGGRLGDEYRRSRVIARAVLSLDRAGRARAVADVEIEAEAQDIRTNGTAFSNDDHVLALARVSGARILCSKDRALRADFKNRAILNGPRGKLYSKGSHKAVLTHNC